MLYHLPVSANKFAAYSVGNRACCEPYETHLSQNMSWCANLLKWLRALMHCCLPLDVTESREHTRRRRYLYFTCQLLQVVLIAFLVAVEVELYIHETSNGPSTTMSNKIEVALGYIGYTFSSVLISISCFFYHSEIVSFERHLSTSSWSLLTTYKQWIRVCALALPVMAWLAVDFVGSSYYIHALPQNSDKCTLPLIPCNKFGYAVAGNLLFLWTTVANSYAWCFIICVGIMLVCELRTVEQKCEALLEGEATLRTRNGITFRSNAVRISDVVRCFRQVKADFERYEKIGGTYALALLVLLVLNTIGIIGAVIVGEAVAENYDKDFVPVWQYVYLCLPALFAVISFGQYMTCSVGSF